MTSVYFIANADHTAVKIGVASDPHARMAELRTGSPTPLHLLAVAPGDERYEAALHARFADLRMQGEWFRHEGDLAELVALLASVPATSAKVPKVRARQAKIRPAAPSPEMLTLIDRWYVELKLCMEGIGYSRFAEAIGVRPYMVSHAVNRLKGRGFPSEWLGAFEDLAEPAAFDRFRAATFDLFKIGEAERG